MTSPDPARNTPASAQFPLRGSYAEALRIGTLLRKETVGGGLLVLMAAIGILWANSPWAEAYFTLRDLEVGYEPWHLQLSLGAWAADGLLAIFFFLIGLELKREFVAGDLRRFSTAIVPVVAAAGGVIIPALVYVAIVAQTPGLLRGWAIPTATDIAFAVAVLALIGSHLPGPLRIFLLTLAVVDDLIAISIIAIFYTETIAIVPLLMGLLTIAVYAVLAQRYRQFFHLKPAAAWLILLPIGVVAWAFVHASGIHATIAGVLLGFTIPVIHRRRDQVPDTEPGLAEEFEHRFRPLSAGFAVPVFAFFSAGVAIGGAEGFLSALTDPVTIGIIAALVVGKPVGIVLATWLTTRVRGIRLDPSLRWVDITGVGLLAGIGFTVSLLVTELSFTATDPHHDHAKVAILLASVVAAVIASALLASRNRRYRKIAQNDAEDTDNDGIPDVYDRP
ncbi:MULTISPECIES: Na+/H+ antiporter NhaA [Microbacterium]|jgi:NhaA family Na+:H+ antiporter|uniref:Na(+)/H(+) antiporter NhaA n=1 Tax=Microbacterium binotii TaxID=462710 RepID=A0ABP6BPK1_9MICO|nr:MULTISPECIES: Na+/H+ antiporter NhaA [Microbacterium]MBD3759097.1 Na+/H+ antiporter NhaA [Microbacterium sp.]MCG7414412.1 Na+/H+ antiporter NhaA [Microbacterium aurum]ONI66706.1 Na+/H+ antiporter NhaA [Microbacterium sp. CSI-V]PZU44107.1 MAG: Na+/H+ antiporter NhaA [Microbacterium sp.]RCL91657.1 MAG: Na+/H+ antiporter NhaA [Microbacterium sp.]